MPLRVRIYEVGPRDGLQNESRSIPLELKVDFIERLVAAGLREDPIAIEGHDRPGLALRPKVRQDRRIQHPSGDRRIKVAETRRDQLAGAGVASRSGGGDRRRQRGCQEEGEQREDRQPTGKEAQ
jgi:hypothetical protein